MPKISDFVPGKVVHVHDKMLGHAANYTLSARYGRDFREDFKPVLSPSDMLSMGVFEGHYMTDQTAEFPEEWFVLAKMSPAKPDISLNFYGVKSRQSLRVWRENGWVPVKVDGSDYKDIDVRGWFQWYCRYYIGRRCPTDDHQINRWKAFARHLGQLKKHCPPHCCSQKQKKDRCRLKQRQALIQWAYYY